MYLIDPDRREVTPPTSGVYDLDPSYDPSENRDDTEGGSVVLPISAFVAGILVGVAAVLWRVFTY